MLCPLDSLNIYVIYGEVEPPSKCKGTGLDKPRGSQEAEALRIPRKSAHEGGNVISISTGHLYLPRAVSILSILMFTSNFLAFNFFNKLEAPNYAFLPSSSHFLSFRLKYSPLYADLRHP